MCWYGKLHNFRIAFKDISVIKVCEKHPDVSSYLSYYQKYMYELNELKHSRIGLSFKKEGIRIEEGLHSYEANSFWRKWKNHILYKDCGGNSIKRTVVGIVPKWAIYFKNSSGEIVSNKLKLVWDLASPVKKSGD